MYCIPKEKIEKLQKVFKGLGDNQIAKLVDMKPADRVKIFEKQLSDEEAILLNRSFEQSVASKKTRALGDWVKKNLDKEYREKTIGQKQKSSVSSFISRKLDDTGNTNKEIVPIKDVLEMTNKEQKEFLKKTFGDDYTKELQTDFDKAKNVKKDVSSIENDIVFAHKNFKTIDEVDKFIDTNVDALAEKSLGVGLTTKETEKFIKLGESFYSETKNIGNNLGKASHLKENIKWGKAYKELVEYTDELMPKSKFKGIVQKYGRASMLAAPKTFFLNIESNSINAISEAILRRIKNGSIASNVSNKVEREYVKFANKMFKETGIDFTRMINLEDTITGINKVVGEESQNIGINWMDTGADFVFNKMLTTPDVAFSSVAFTDSLALNASRMAKGNKKLADKLFKESTNINARGDAGVLRTQAINDARLATYTNDSWSSKTTSGLRKLLNNIPGLGDWVMPFIKTPANVAELGADYAGLGVIKGAITVGKHFYKNGKIDEATMREVMRDVARSGVGFSMAYGLASMVDVENFNGVYDPRKIKIDQIGNLGYNAVKVKLPGGKERWISTDYLGPIGVPFVAMMYAKKYGGASGYITGATSQYLSQLPLVDGGELFSYLKDLTRPDEKTAQDVLKDIGKNAANGISSRLIPGISYDIARATDAVQRDTYQKKFVVDTPMGEMNFDKFIQKIPYFYLNGKYSRKSLPIKTDALGRVMYESSPIESMLFGARDRTARTDKVTGEILRLREVKQLPSIKDLRFMNSTKVDELKEKVGKEEFYNVARKYGEDMAVEFDKEINKESYQKLSDEEKKTRLYKIGQDLYVKTLKRHGIKYR